MSTEIDDVDNQLVLTPERLKEVKLCVNTKEGFRQSLLGMTLGGGLTGLTFSLTKMALSKSHIATLAFVGAVYGYVVVKYFRTKNCIAQILNLPNDDLHNKGITLIPANTENENMYSNRRGKREGEDLIKPDVLPESTKTIFDMDTSPRMDLFDDFPTITENAKADALEITAPERSVTYKELRQKNRKSYFSKHPIQKSIWSVDEDKAQKEELETGPVVSDPFSEPSSGKRRTKYGDMWD